MNDFETWRQTQAVAKPQNDFEWWRASQPKYQSVDTGMQQSVSDQGTEAILGVSPEPPKNDFEQWRDKSLTEKMIDLAPAPVIPGVPIPIPGGVGIARRVGEMVYGKPIEQGAVPALEAGLDIPTYGLATALPAVWGAAKGVAESPRYMEPGSSVLDKASVVAKSALRGAVGESPLLTAVYERAGGVEIPRISEGENISDVNRLVTGSPLPELSKNIIDIGGGTLGMISAEKAGQRGLQAIGGAVERRLPQGVAAQPTSLEEMQQLTQAPEIGTSTEEWARLNQRNEILSQRRLKLAEISKSQGVQISEPTNAQVQVAIDNIDSQIAINKQRAQEIAEKYVAGLPEKGRLPESPSLISGEQPPPRTGTSSVRLEQPVGGDPRVEEPERLLPSKASSLGTPSMEGGPAFAPEPPPLPMRPPSVRPIDAVDSIIEGKASAGEPQGVTITKGSPIEQAHSGVSPQDLLKEVVAKSPDVEIVRKDGSKFRLRDLIMSPSKIPILKPVFQLAQAALNKADLLTKQKNLVQEIVHRYLGKDENSTKAFAEAMWKGDAVQKRWSLPEFREVVKPFGLVPEQEINVWKAYNLRRNFSDYLAREIGQSTGKMTGQDVEAVRILQSGDTVEQKASALAKMGLDMDEAEGILQSMSYREGHVPHVFRENMVYDKTTNRPVASFRTLKEAVDWADQSVTKFPGLELSVRPKSVQWHGQMAKSAIVNDQRYTNLLKRLENQYEMSVPEAREYLMNAGVQPKIQLTDRADFLTPAGRGRMFGHLEQRKGASGFRTDDIIEIFDSYDKGAIRYISTNPFKKNATSIFEKLYGTSVDAAKGNEAWFVANYINGVNGVPGMTEEAINSLFKKWLPGLAERMPTSRPGIYVMNKVNHAVSVAKLGVWNPSALFVNLTQNILTFAKSDTDSFAKALVETARRGKEAKAIWRALGIDAKTGLAEAGEYTMSARAGDVVNGSMALFGWAEKRNREVAALAGYYDAVKSGATHKQALEGAAKLVRETQFEYNVIDTPFLFRGAAGRTLGQFKQYGSKYIEVVAGMNPTQFVKWAVPTALMAGMGGIPFAKAANSILVSTLGDEWDIETRAKQSIKEWMAENSDNKAVQIAGKTMMYGALSNVAGIDVSQRIGQSDVLPMFEQPEQLLGPAFSTAVSTVKNVAGLESGKTNREDVIKGISPGAEGVYFAGREAYKAATGDQSPTVVRGMNQKDLYEPTTSEKVAKGMSFRPVVESNLRDQARAKVAYRGIEEKLKNAVLNGLLSGSNVDDYLDKWVKLRVTLGEDVTPEGLQAALERRTEEQNIDEQTRFVADEKNPPAMRLRVLNEMQQRQGK